MNRRAFLGGAFLGGAFLGGAFLGRDLSAEPSPHCAAPALPRARLAVASYPFRAQLDPAKAKMKLLDFPAMVVERFGVHGIEPLDEHFPSTEPAYLQQFSNALHKTGTHVVNIPVGRMGGSFYDPVPAKRNAAIATARKWIDVAVAIGSPGVRVHIQPLTGVAPEVNRTSACLTEVAQYGAKNGIVVNLENDDPASEDAFFLSSVMDRVASPWLRALPDFCNSMLLNRGAGYNYRAITAMFQKACNISHLKEVETDEGKLFRIDLERTFAIARAAHYRGYFSVEWDSEGDPFEGTQNLISRSLKILEKRS